MPTPQGYEAWGYLGGLIFIVIAFLVYLWRRDAASLAREKSMQEFSTQLFKQNQDATGDLITAIRELMKEFQAHRDETNRAISTMNERTRPIPTGQSGYQRRKDDREERGL